MAARRGIIESLNKKRDADSPKPTFGFIKPEEGGKSIFFIPTSMQQTSPVRFDDLRVGMRVEFTTIDSDRGPRAIEVLVLNGGRIDATGGASPMPTFPGKRGR